MKKQITKLCPILAILAMAILMSSCALLHPNNNHHNKKKSNSKSSQKKQRRAAVMEIQTPSELNIFELYKG